MAGYSLILCILVFLVDKLDANVACISKLNPNEYHCTVYSKDAVVRKLPPNLKTASTIFLNGTSVRHIEDGELHSLHNLENLHLHRNKLTTLSPNWFAKLRNLLRINLSRNMIASVPPDTFAANQKLEYVDLSRNNIVRYYDASENLVNAVMDLSYNPLVGLDIRRVGTLYLNHTAIEKLYLKYSVAKLFVPDSRLKEFSFNFADLNRLETIDFSGNNLTDIRNITVLQGGPTYLDLSRNYFGSLTPDTFLGLDRLRYLNLSQTVVLNLYYGLFWSQKNLKVLDLSGNHLWNLNTNKLYPVYLDELYIQNNAIYTIVDERGMLTSLKKLGIYGNSLSCEVLFDLYMNATNYHVELFIPPGALRFGNNNIAGMACTDPS